MSLQIYIAHTGDRLLADAISFASPEALRSWITSYTTIPAERQILMTAKGKNVKQQHLLTETEVFLYDKQYVTPHDYESPPDPLLPSLELREAPRTLSDQNTLQAWRDLFMSRRSWALEVTEAANTFKGVAERNLEQTEIIQRAGLVALENVKNHLGSIQSKFEGTQKWATDMLKDYNAALDDWEENLDVLGKVPARKDFTFLLPRPSTPKGGSARDHLDEVGTLQDLIDVQDIRMAVSDLSSASVTFHGRLQEQENTIRELAKDTAVVESRLSESTSWQHEDVGSLFEEAETLAKKISSDYEDVLRLPDNSKSVATASRRALVHTRDFLPSLKSLVEEIYQQAQEALHRRQACLIAAMRGLQGISEIQSKLAGFQSQVANLDMEQHGMEAFDTINMVFQAPVAYGSTLIEAIRRTEWLDKQRAESDLLNEETTIQKDDEQRRRKKWAKSMEGFLNGIPDSMPIELGISMPPLVNEWPALQRQEIFAYIDDLKNAQINDAVQQVTLLLKELDSPETGRKRASRAFKNGSVYDASFGTRSFILGQADESIRTLKVEKLKLEDKLKASDSRVRKLEDLLHRQSQMSRPPSGIFGPPAEPERATSSPVGLPSPRPGEVVSRRSSVSSRRMSNQNQDEKPLVRKIVALEEEVARLQQEAHVERRSSTESRDRMQEAESTKKDLMANLEAQRQEFDDERQLLDDETHKLKIRLEEVEDELDRILGSRDHQKHKSDQALGSLQTELDHLRTTSTDEISKAQGQADFIRNDFIIQRDRALTLERQVQQLKEEKSHLHTQNMSLANQLRDAENETQEQILSLQSAHEQLSPGGSAPEDLPRLIKAIEILSEGLAIHARGMESASQLSSAENKALEESLGHAEAQMKRLNDKLTSSEALSFSLRETLAQERNKLTSLRKELADEKTELRNLRSKFAAGETGSEALKERLSEEERKVTDLMEKLAEAESSAQRFEQEMAMWKDKAHDLELNEKGLRNRFDTRGVRAKDLSQRLFYQNDRMIRMLEQLGFSVTCVDDRLVIQRASKVNASTMFVGAASMTEFSASMNRTLSGSSPTHHYSNASDLDTLYWMSDSDAHSEDIKFQAFSTSLARLDVEAAAELITKRYKDVETLARKYQKDSRAYREKAHRLQSEAHDKIAYRSFKEGDLALFLPTRNQATRPWAAFNVGAPHYFLREQDIHKLQTRDWLLARISKVEERIVDLSRSMTNGLRNQPDRQSLNTEASDGASTRSVDDENPFELSDGLRWYLIDAAEEKPGAPSTPGLGKSTVAATNIEVKGSIRLTKDSKRTRDSTGSVSAGLATKTLNKSLDSRRSSTGSRKGHTASPSMTAAPLLPAPNENDGQDQAPLVQVAETEQEQRKDGQEEAGVFEEDAGRASAKASGGSRASPSNFGIGSDVLGQGHSSGGDKPATSAEKGKSRPWDKLWSIDYRMESGIE